MKYVLFFAIILSNNVMSKEKVAKADVFEQRKARILEGLNERKSSIEKAIACTNAAKEMKQLKECNHSLKEERKKAREKMKEHREKMLKAREEKRQKFINKKK
jgi:hypothetical protein